MPKLPGPPYSGADYPQPQGIEVGWWGGKFKTDPDGVLHFRAKGFFDDPMRCGASPREDWRGNPTEWKSECVVCFDQGAIF